MLTVETERAGWTYPSSLRLAYGDPPRHVGYVRRGLLELEPEAECLRELITAELARLQIPVGTRRQFEPVDSDSPALSPYVRALLAATRKPSRDELTEAIGKDREVKNLGRWREPDDIVLLHARFVSSRHRVFGDVDFTGQIIQCLLCGYGWTAEFVTPISLEPLGFCQDCLHRADLSITQLTSRTADLEPIAALREVADTEYASSPMLRSALVRLRVPVGTQVTSDQVAHRLRLRTAIGAGLASRSWGPALKEAGLLEFGLRLPRGTLISAQDGHMCRSLAEKAIDDVLHIYGIGHETEPPYPTHPVLNPNGRLRADWALPDGTLVEYWGLPNQATYVARMKQKRQLAAELGIRLIELAEDDVLSLDERLVNWRNGINDG